MKQVWIALLLVAGCQRAAPPSDGPGARLERAAIARGLVVDPASRSLTGSWGSDTDRLCVVPDGREQRLGASIDYGDGQTCAARGIVERRGERLRVTFGDCRFDATFDGDRIAFPAELPAACTRLCAGRASLAALTVTRLSESEAEARTLRAPAGQLLCAR